MADLEVQTVASKLAFEFNDSLERTSTDPNLKLKFLMAKVVRFDGMNGGPPRFMAYEKRFRGATREMVKYTNNLDFVLNPGADEATLCDLQGIVTTDKMGQETLLLTDPAIHCDKHLRFGKTNLRALGINKFFDGHVCNEYCRALGLTKPPTAAA